MRDLMEYKDYCGSVHYSDEDRVFHGKVEFIRSLITYEGTDVEGLRGSFEEAVDDYLELCEREGVSPEKPFKGSFNIRPGVTLHRKAALFAKERGINLNQVIVEALKNYLEPKPRG